ncbi:hypothetical protein [Verrucosispora sp. WMMD1129]|uniref:hypothetical protein n=1 Tax=Verrucosispora sp. WMMD1129 TaxID=3016093 RepID=UPI00249A81A6|nr:hypothetical protein [Verrucosispora sp. WMMD1129]WFE44996.1 hypothetical protein O7624_11935 [Verrucosispora sp. WMMD1129]WFE46294.1 hypothetical protein O7624_19050 [Verrucosispora sp. WMMD1129]
MTATQYVLLIVAGGTGTPLAVFLVARRLVEGHADSTAAAIRRQHTRQTPTRTKAVAR